MNLSPAIYDVYNVWFKIHKAINMANSINNNNQMKQKFVNRAMGSQNELNEKAELLKDEILRSITLISELIRKIRSGEKNQKVFQH